MENVMFKSIEVTGATKEEALAQAPFNVNLPGADCTAALRNLKKKMAGQPFTDADLKQFMADQLKAKTKCSAGNGCYIVLEAASKDTRKRPYEVESVKNEGTRKWKTYHIGRLGVKDAKGKEVFAITGTKAEALAKAKKLMAELKSPISIFVEKRVVEGSPIEAVVNYTPSKNASFGRYRVFGIEATL